VGGQLLRRRADDRARGCRSPAGRCGPVWSATRPPARSTGCSPRS
jgi:hypothetical protein